MDRRRTTQNNKIILGHIASADNSGKARVQPWTRNEASVLDAEHQALERSQLRANYKSYPGQRSQRDRQLSLNTAYVGRRIISVSES